MRDYSDSGAAAHGGVDERARNEVLNRQERQE
jgi:hypothetical protein